MKFRLLALLVGLAVLATVTAAPVAAGATQPIVGSVLTPGQTGATDPAQWGGWGYPWAGGAPAWGGSGSSDWSTGGCGCMGGTSWSGGGFGPWWAGMPLSAISAASGFTWPWAPWYWSPQWWTLAALAH
jgi:hypothetical protein